MKNIVLSATGLYTPPYAISNEELVECFNSYVNDHNLNHPDPLLPSSTDFIFKASGIKQRYVVEKKGILDPKQMRPNNLERTNTACSLQAEMGIHAAKDAMEKANISSQDIDGVIVACTDAQRVLPAISIEIQAALGIKGYALDMHNACSSAIFGIEYAHNAIKAERGNTYLVVNPEPCSLLLNFRDRETHFIFGDAATACIIQEASCVQNPDSFNILDIELKTHYSNNLQSNFGFINRTNPTHRDDKDKMITQQGRKVFKEVIPLVSELILGQLSKMQITPAQLKRLWLHQANINMNQLIAKKILGHVPPIERAPIILDEYANTSSAGTLIAFHKHHAGLNPGDLGLLSAFGAGYALGSIILEKR